MPKHIKLLLCALAACLALCLAGCARSTPTAGPAASPAGTAQPAGSAAATSEQPTVPVATAAPSPAAPVQAQPEGGGVLVAYFSATGNTRHIAQQIATLAGGTLYEIAPAEAYTAADLDHRDSSSRSSLEMADPSARPQLAAAPPALDGYATVYLGYPIWHGQAPRLLSTFVESANFDGVTVIPFCTSGSSGIGQSATALAGQAGSSNWLPGQRFAANVSEEDLRAWLAQAGQ